MGKFDIIAPYLTDQWPDSTNTMTLKLSPSSTSSHLWGSFDFGIVSGIIRSSAKPPTSTGHECVFFWRGRESGEGQMEFGEDETSHIIFLGNGKIKGRMEWMAGFDFVGMQDDETSRRVVWQKSVKGWKKEWRGINERSYESENIARWGKWGGDPAPDKPYRSDTSVGGGEDSGSDDVVSFDGYDDDEGSFNMAF
jgi:hypothetical protein